MKYFNSNNVQVVVASETKNYYLPPKTTQEISEEIKVLPKGVRPVIESLKSEPESKSNKKNG